MKVLAKTATSIINDLEKKIGDDLQLITTATVKIIDAVTKFTNVPNYVTEFYEMFRNATWKERLIWTLLELTVLFLFANVGTGTALNNIKMVIL